MIKIDDRAGIGDSNTFFPFEFNSENRLIVKGYSSFGIVVEQVHHLIFFANNEHDVLGRDVQCTGIISRGVR